MFRFVLACAAALVWAHSAFACNVPNPNLNAPPFVDGCPVPASALNNLTPMAATTAALQTMTYIPNGMVIRRNGYYAIGDGGDAYYQYSTSSCSLNSGNGDGGYQIKPTSVTGCFIQIVPITGLAVGTYGVSASQSAAANAASLSAAASAAYTLGVPLNLCISQNAAVTIPTTGSPLFNDLRVISCAATKYQAPAKPATLSYGAIFYTLGKPGDTCPGLWTDNGTLTFEGLLSLDLNNNDGVGLRLDGSNNVDIKYGPQVANTGTGTYTYSDCVNTSGSYPDAAVAVKGIFGVEGSFYASINHPILVQPAYATVGVGYTGGVGIWVGTTAGQTGERPNTFNVTGGLIHGYQYGILLQSVGDARVVGTDISGDQIGAWCGPSGGSCPNAIFIKPYLEADAIGVLFDIASSNGKLESAASIAGTGAPCVDNQTTASINPCLSALNIAGAHATPSVFPSSGNFIATSFQGMFRVAGTGAGGGGGGAQASTGTTNSSVGGGGGGGEYGDFLCADPFGINFSHAVVTDGTGGAGGAGSANGTGGGSTTIVGLNLAADWQASTTYNSPPAGPAYITPTANNAGGYTFVAIKDGASAGSAPVFPQTPGQTVVDNNTEWENIGKTDWSASMTAVVNQPVNGPIVSTVINPSVNNTLGYAFRAIQAGTAGTSEPNWNVTNVGQYIVDGGVWWQNIGKVVSITLAGGSGGSGGGSPTTGNFVGQPAGTQSGTSNSGCVATALTPGLPSPQASIIGGANGTSGSGGSNVLGRGGLGIQFNATSNQAGGQNGSGLGGGGGSGAVSANNATGSAQTGGTGGGGFVSISPISGTTPW